MRSWRRTCCSRLRRLAGVVQGRELLSVGERQKRRGLARLPWTLDDELHALLGERACLWQLQTHGRRGARARSGRGEAGCQDTPTPRAAGGVEPLAARRCSRARRVALTEPGRTGRAVARRGGARHRFRLWVARREYRTVSPGRGVGSASNSTSALLRPPGFGGLCRAARRPPEAGRSDSGAILGLGRHRRGSAGARAAQRGAPADRNEEAAVHPERLQRSQAAAQRSQPARGPRPHPPQAPSDRRRAGGRLRAAESPQVRLLAAGMHDAEPEGVLEELRRHVPA